MWASWQSFPLTISPTAFTLGFLAVSWYAVCYLCGALGVIVGLSHSQKMRSVLPEREDLWSLVNMVLWGMLIGARLGFVFFYGGVDYWHAPWRIVSPYDFTTGLWTGIRGLSFYGGLLGGGLALYFFGWRRKLAWWPLADAVAVSLPVALFFGRVGNFLNGELIGRVTSVPWGVHSVLGETVLRHPSQLYEAFGEGLGLFLWLYFLGRKPWPPRFLSLVFLLSYGLIRFSLEFFRAPDPGAHLFFGILTLNQILALLLCLLALALSLGLRRSWYNEKVAE